MKSMIKASLITALLVLTSCAHHRGGCCKKDGQCEMKTKCEQCPMKTEAAPATEPAKK